MNDWEKAIQYVRENKTWTLEEEQVALIEIGSWRRPLNMTSTGILFADKIRELLDEYGRENNLNEDWWEEYGTEEDVFFKL